MRGTVKFYDCDKGFGFITGNDGADYYFSRTCLPRRREYDPVEGDPVEFDTREIERGLIAHHIDLDPDHTYKKDNTNAMPELQVQRGSEG